MFNREYAQRIKEQYPVGTRIRLESMNDPQAVPSGTEGTVIGVDSIGQIMMKWDNGRSLSLVPGEDSFSIIREKEKSEQQKATSTPARKRTASKNRGDAR